MLTLDNIEAKFHEEKLSIYYTGKKEINFNASRFLQMVSEKGGLQAAKLLISKSGGTYGFEVLWENCRLDLSVEALVLNPEFTVLFSDEEKRICRERLEQFGYAIS
jgi:hypothetical protein